MAERREVRVAFLGDARDLQRATQSAERSLTSFEATSSRVSKGFSVAAAGIAAGAAALGAAGIGAAIAGKSFVDAASSYEEAASKVKVVFGPAAAKVNEFTKKATTSFGISERKAMDFTGQLGALLRPMGFAEDAAADMSTQLVGLAGDFASFYNTPVEDALIAIRAGLVGEIEPLHRFGIQMDEASKKQKALEMGLYSGKGALSTYAEAQATMAIIFQQSTLAQGDYLRTQDSTANRLRLLQEQWDNFKVKIGEALLPLAGWIADTGVKILNWLTDLKTAFDQGGWSAVWEKLSKGIQEGWNTTVWPWLQALPGRVGEWVKSTGAPALGSAMGGLGEAFKDWASKLWGGEDVTVKSTLISTGSVLQINETKHIDGLKDKLAALPGQIKDLVVEKAEELKNNFAPWAASAVAWFDDASRDLEPKVDKLIDDIKKWCEKEENLNKLVAAGTEMGLSIALGLALAIPQINAMIYIIGRNIVDEFGKMALQVLPEAIGGLFRGIIDTLKKVPEPFRSFLGLGAVIANFEMMMEGFAKGTAAQNQRAMGGPVAAGRPYLVGERGPELFVPGRSGTIVPNGAGNTYVVNADGLNATQALQVLEAHERMALAGAA